MPICVSKVHLDILNLKNEKLYDFLCIFRNFQCALVPMKLYKLVIYIWWNMMSMHIILNISHFLYAIAYHSVRKTVSKSVSQSLSQSVTLLNLKTRNSDILHITGSAKKNDGFEFL